MFFVGFFGLRFLSGFCRGYFLGVVGFLYMFCFFCFSVHIVFKGSGVLGSDDEMDNNWL